MGDIDLSWFDEVASVEDLTKSFISNKSDVKSTSVNLKLGVAEEVPVSSVDAASFNSSDVEDEEQAEGDGSGETQAVEEANAEGNVDEVVVEAAVEGDAAVVVEGDIVAVDTEAVEGVVEGEIVAQNVEEAEGENKEGDEGSVVEEEVKSDEEDKLSEPEEEEAEEEEDAEAAKTDSQEEATEDVIDVAGYGSKTDDVNLKAVTDLTAQSTDSGDGPMFSVDRQLSELSIGSGEGEPNEAQLERDKYCDQYRTLLNERAIHVRRNTVLQRKLHEHYKKRKMDSIFKTDVLVTPEMESKYAKKLNLYNEIKTIEETERATIEAELKYAADEEQRLEKELEEEFTALIQLERETGMGLIDSKTGFPIPDKLVERYLKRQTNRAKELGAQRLAYIKIRDKVNSKEAAIRDLDVVGGNLRMYDYEQLRIENQNLSDKIEEREEELGRLRERTTQAIQILAHYREKSSALSSDVEVTAYSLRELEQGLEIARANLGSLKRTRDKLRADFARESDEAGLLNKPKLLRDFEEAIDTVAQLTEELENVRNTCADEQRQLVVLRDSIKRGNELQNSTKELLEKDPTDKRSIFVAEEEEEMFQMK